jgi:hypothetical protein
MGRAGGLKFISEANVIKTMQLVETDHWMKKREGAK